MTSVETPAPNPGPRRAADNAAFMVDLLRMVELFRDNPDLPGPSTLGNVRVRISMPPPVLRRIARQFHLPISSTPAGCGQMNLQADWQLDLTWVSLHALEHQDGAPQIPADPIRDQVIRGEDPTKMSEPAAIVDAQDERLAHHRTR